MNEGILLSNIGSPETPSFWAVRRYLKEFLSDPKVIDLPRWKWLPILHLIILNIRPFKSAHNYQKIWMPEGSPLLVWSQRITGKLQVALPDRPIALGMSYGKPSLTDARRELERQGVKEIIHLPLYPQASKTTGGEGYHDHPLYIAALKNAVEAHWARQGRKEKLLLSYHGLPERYIAQGDPYLAQCEETTSLLAQALGLGSEEYLMSFQSRVGLEKWLRPYTHDVLRDWAQFGVRSVDVICPGFSCDCLETLEEINIRYREQFMQAGGKVFEYIPCLNDSDKHVQLLLARMMDYPRALHPLL
jgi:ferrochelatase